MMVTWLCAAAWTTACAPAEGVNSIDILDWDRAVSPPRDWRARNLRAGCSFKAGALPAETQGESRPNGADIPIDHILVVMQENRSFDHYFRALPAYGQADVEIAPVEFSNPDDAGIPVLPHHADKQCAASTPHDWDSSHKQVDGGKMDGFVRTSEGQSAKGEPEETLYGERAMEYYDERDIPFYYWLANTFSLADHYHCSLLGPTWPNRMYLYAGSSYGHLGNGQFEPPHTIFEYMDIRGVDYKLYFSDHGGLGDYLRAFVRDPDAHVRTMEDYFADAAAGSLPEVAFVNSTFASKLADSTWEHAPHLPSVGQKWVAEVIQALTKSPDWPRSALFLTYDEHGGLWDHVVPPPACPPDSLLPQLGKNDVPGAFNTYGVRVPMMVVSPWAKHHHVSHEVYDHTSILRFIEARFVIGALTARDANAEAPWDMFDFDQPSFLVPPSFAIPDVDPKEVQECQEMFPKI